VLPGLLAWLVAPACGSGGGVDASQSSGGTGGVITGAGGSVTAATSTAAASAGSSAGSGGSGGAGGSAPVCPPTPPIEGPGIGAPDHQWTWVPIDGAVCRDGSGTGIGVRLNSASTKVYIYLEGGGACFNAETCAIALGSFDQAAFTAWAGTVGLTGIFDTTQTVNPLQEWNAVYVPYCSGDVHAGDASGASVPGGGPTGQDFLGYENVALYLQRIVATFPAATQVLLTGISAGGFGAAFNYDRVAAAFCPLPVTLLDDSGPPMSDTYLAPCLQKQWRSLWNLPGVLPAACTACTEPSGGGIVNYITYLNERWPKSPKGLISSTQDAVISTFFGFGSDDCTATTPLSGATYAAGLEDLRDNYLAESPLWGTYFVDSITHTYLLGPGFYTTTVNGELLTTWVGDLLDGQPDNVGP
jgi:Pectinacetylesterase